MDDDIFWNIQLGIESTTDNNGQFSTNCDACWLAPSEREERLTTNHLIPINDNDEDHDKDSCYQWVELYLPINRVIARNRNNRDHSNDCDRDEDKDVEEDAKNEITNLLSKPSLQIRTIQGSNVLMGHVGEEIWDAAKLLCAQLCLVSQQKHKKGTICVRGKRVLELGAGCGVVGMCAAAIGASEVVCTDYLPTVLDNLAFNLKHNAKAIDYLRVCSSCDKNIVLVEESCDPCDDYQNDNGNGSRNGKNETDSNTGRKKTVMKCAELDWNSLVSKDLLETEWFGHERNISTKKKNLKEYPTGDLIKNAGEIAISYSNVAEDFSPDIILGSALIYSPEGALACADSIHHFFQIHGTSEAFVLQMPDRPGFDRFLRRLETLGLYYELQELSEEVYTVCVAKMGKIATTRDTFTLCAISQTQSVLHRKCDLTQS